MRNSRTPAADPSAALRAGGGRYNGKNGPPWKAVPTKEMRFGCRQKDKAGRSEENVGAPTFKVTLEVYSVLLTECRTEISNCRKKSG